MRRCTQSASPATSPQKIATTFSLTTHLRPELKPAPNSLRDQFWTPQAALDTNMPNYAGAIVTAKEVIASISSL
jgi:hypothetical protein